jgi:tRNA pseudouridine55 synthase
VCSAGFYVRSLAHDLGAVLGTGGHVVELRRLASGEIDLSGATPLQVLEEDADAARRRLVPMAHMLPSLSQVRLSPEGIRRAVTGQTIRPDDCAPPVDARMDWREDAWIRMLDGQRNLIGLARVKEASSLLHPSIVLM